MKRVFIPTNKRIDFFFSYWIDTWSLLYILYNYNKPVTYCSHYIANPKLALLFAIFMNIIELISMIYFSNSFIHIIIYVIIVSIGKGIPLAFLINTRICPYDIYVSIILFLIYLLWLHLHNVTLYEYVIQAYKNVKYNKPVGPITHYFMKNLQTNIMFENETRV